MLGEDTQQLRKSEGTRQELLRAAIYCFSTLGLYHTTIRKISKRAGVATGLINHYFPSSEDIFYEAVLFVFEDVRDKARARAEESAPEAKLIAALEVNYELFLTNVHHYRCFAMSYTHAGFSSKFKKLHTDIFESFVTKVSGYMTEALRAKKIRRPKVAVREFAESILEELDGSLLFYHFTSHTDSRARYTERHLRRARAKIAAFMTTHS